MLAYFAQLYRIYRRVTAPLIALLPFCILSCSLSTGNPNAYIARLKNRGIVPLSANNPYIAANAMLRKEMDRSSDLKGFIEHRGSPSALQVSQGLFSPLEMEFYYPESKEFYLLEEDKETWIINGPKRMPDSLHELILETAIFDERSNVALLDSAEPAPQAVPPSPAEKHLKDKGPAPEVKPTELPLPIGTQITAETPLPDTTADILPQIPTLIAPTATAVNKTLGNVKPSAVILKELAAEYGKVKAEKSPRGDIVHYVSLPGETLAILARWYTFDAENQQRLMRINRLEGKTLSLGDQLVVPRYLVKNEYIINEAALVAIEKLIAQGSL